ncbi:MAG: hypothetical protein QNM02_21270, partial [Acidimicrobiia bacterium]|nr:hypothetical protein [Acidimicrobiia bacterium]
QVVLDASTTAVDICRAFEHSSARYIALRPVDADPDRTGWLSPLTAQCARANVGAAGPLVTSSDGRLVSAGRVHHPAVIDLFQGIDADNHGPWGAFLVRREVASVSPLGAVFDRSATLEVGGFDLAAMLGDRDPVVEPEVDPDALVDITVAVLCTKLRLAGLSTIWTPQSRLTLPPSALFTDQQLAERRRVFRYIAGVFPQLAEDPYSPIGVHRI